MHAVQPDLRAGMHAAEIQRDAHPPPIHRDLERPPVPSRACIGCPKGSSFQPEVPDDLLVIATEPLPLPTSRHLDPIPEYPRILKPSFLRSGIFRIKPEVPWTAQAEPSLPGMSQRRIYPNRCGLFHRHCGSPLPRYPTQTSSASVPGNTRNFPAGMVERNGQAMG